MKDAMPQSKRDQLTQLAAMFGEPEPEAHKDAANRALDEYHAALRTMQASAKQAGLHIHCDSDLQRLFSAGHRLADVWQRRAKATERGLRAVLALDCVSDEQRTAIIDVLHGKAPARDPKLLTDTERRMLDDYRAMDAAGRQMLRTLIVRVNGKKGRT